MFKRTLADQLENDELLVTLDVLEAEMRLSNPRIPVIRGMLANLETYSELKEFKLRLMGYYNIKILNKTSKNSLSIQGVF